MLKELENQEMGRLGGLFDGMATVPRTLVIGIVLAVHVGCDAAPSPSLAPSTEAARYSLDCGGIPRPACEETAARFVAEIQEMYAEEVVAVSFPLPDTIDVTLSDGRHVTSTLEPEASDG